MRTSGAHAAVLRPQVLAGARQALPVAHCSVSGHRCALPHVAKVCRLGVCHSHRFECLPLWQRAA